VVGIDVDRWKEQAPPWALFPVVKRQSEAVALGFVTSRIGLIGAPPLIASAIAALFRGNDDLFSVVEGAAPSRQAH